MRKQLESKIGLELKHRDEAHVTIVTPPEFSKVLAKKLTMEDISKLAPPEEIQSVPLRILCLGKGEIQRDGKALSAYFLVVESEELIAIRRKIESSFVAKGGTVREFIPEQYFPHISIGFSDRDLHFEDGVVKDKSSCIAPVELVAPDSPDLQ